jgi:hypothetical protein
MLSVEYAICSCPRFSISARTADVTDPTKLKQKNEKIQTMVKKNTSQLIRLLWAKQTPFLRLKVSFKRIRALVGKKPKADVCKLG